MTLVVEQNYASGVPQTAVAAFSPTGVAWHWTAGGTGRAGWNGTVSHLIATRATINASYHGGFWVEHGPEHVGCRTFLQWIVPTTRAAHSIAPSQVFQYSQSKPVDVQNARFVEVRRILGTKSSDPNAACIAVSYAGMPADLALDLQCPVFRADLQDLARQLVAHPAVIDRPHFGHGWIQPITRYEMDEVGLDFVGMLYDVPITQPEEDMIYWKPVQEDWDTKVGAKFWDGDGNEKTFDAVVRVRSVAESAGGVYRLVKYGDNELLVVIRKGLIAVAGSRVPPAPSYGFPPAAGGFTQADLDAAAKTARDVALAEAEAAVQAIN